MKLVLAISIPSCALLAFTGPWILRVFFGKTMHAPMSLLIALAAWGIVSAVSSPIAMLLNGANYLKIQVIVATIASICNLGLSIVLTRHYGVIGVCLGSLITQIVLAIPICSLAVRNLLGKLTIRKMLAGSAALTAQLQGGSSQPDHSAASALGGTAQD